jgi:hypothetical protein
VIRILGSHKRFCDGLSRRDWLQVGALAPFGLSTASWSRATSHSSPSSVRGFGKARRCILLYLWGSPSQLETFDPKPDAPPEVRGEFRSIATDTPGVRIGEILPRLSRLLGQVTILRTLTHPYPIHGTAYAMTAMPTTDLNAEGGSQDPRHWPFVGSVVDYLAERADPKPSAVPRNYGLPFQLGSRRRVKPGPFGGFLGRGYDTIWSDFRARGTREVLRDSGAPDVPTKVIADPYLGILPTDRFDSSGLDGAITLDRLHGRASLLDQLVSARQQLDRQSNQSAFGRHHALASTVLTSGKLAQALDVQREPNRLRERYGTTLFGQSCLAARRLLEAGGKFVTVCWDEYGLVNTGWDTHVHMRSRLKDELGPGLDHALATLLEDLGTRGMLDDTGIVVMSEHGRTPLVQKVAEGGRDHWSRAYSALFAGAAFARGRVVGRTDRIAGEVAETPFSPKDVIATLFHVLGIDPELEIHDHLGRPYRIGGTGRVRTELLGSG